MIVDLRTYTIKPGRMPEFLKLYEEKAWPLQQKYLGRCLGYYVTAEGSLNRVVHLWAYENQGDREARRNAMAADPAWVAYLAESRQLDALAEQQNSFLRPTSFSPVQ